MIKKVLLLGGSGLVGQSVVKALRDDYQITPTAGHSDPKNGYRLTVEEPDKLSEILIKENPEIVISSIRGDFQSQMNFHKILADWLKGKRKQLLYMSTANVFDGDMSKPWTEADLPAPKSDYDIFKRDCEAMLSKQLGEQLTVFRLAAVWDTDCPRVRQLRLHSSSVEPHVSNSGYMINITLAKQIGEYAKYVLSHKLHGIFHVGTTDTVDYFDFEKKVCEALKIKTPKFVTEISEKTVFFAVLPSRKEIPDCLQMTVADVLTALNN